MKDDQIAGLVAFLRARLTEDEQTASYDPDGRDPHPADLVWTYEPDGDEEFPGGNVVARGHYIVQDQPQAIGAHIARHDPARVLRDIQASRGVLSIYDQMTADLNAPDFLTRGMAPVAITVLAPVLCHLARAWSDHPDYQAEAWKPIA